MFLIFAIYIEITIDRTVVTALFVQMLQTNIMVFSLCLFTDGERTRFFLVGQLSTRNDIIKVLYFRLFTT